MALTTTIVGAVGCGGGSEASEVTATVALSTIAASTTVTTEPTDPEAWMVVQIGAGGRAEIRVVDEAGNVIATPASDVAGGNQTNPDWSPDGQMLTFGMTETDGRDDLWVVEADGANPQKLYDCLGDCTYIDDAAWSRDGQSIAVCIMRSVDRVDLGRLAVVEVATGELTDLAAFGDTQFCSGPRWSPDGSQIVLEVVQRSGTSLTDEVTAVTLSIVDVATGAIVQELTDPALFAATADWNSVTGEIVYSALAAADASGPDLFAVLPDGSAPRRLTFLAEDGGAAEEPSISIDGSTVIFVGSGAVSGLAQLDLASGTVTQAFDVARSDRHPRHRP